MNINYPSKKLQIETPRSLYKWARVWNATQRKFFTDDVRLRREKQIEDFIVLNEFQRVHFVIDTDVFVNFDQTTWVTHPSQADLVVITDQKFSRYPCPVIIDQIELLLLQCSNLYICLNRHYINIDNSYTDTALSNNFCLAIAQWLRKSLPDSQVIDLSQNYLDTGQSFTWALPDRHYFINRK
jgi:hypothetical protein